MVQPRVLNLNVAVTNILKLLQRTLGEHIELVTSLAPGLAHVLADQGHIEQILVNLAVNARDAMPGGGRLIIETGNIDVDEAYAATHANLSMGHYAAIKVSDNGPGMPPEVADHAFEPFFTTKPKGEGSGLGLATIYGIVTQAGGNVRIYTEPGIGTTITVLLPVTGQPPVAEEHPPDDGESGGSELVLLVEDEPALREVARRILTRNGYRVITAGDGFEAIRVTKKCRDHIDLLLTDVIMPGMQGREVAQQVRELQPDVAVLYMSGYTEGLLSAQGVLEPGINLVEKPFNEKSLLLKVREILHARLPALIPGRSGREPRGGEGGLGQRVRQGGPAARPADRGEQQHRHSVHGIDLPARRERSWQRDDRGQRCLDQVPGAEQPGRPAHPPAGHLPGGQPDRRTGRQHQDRPVAGPDPLEHRLGHRRCPERPSRTATNAPVTAAPARKPNDTRACCASHSCALRSWDLSSNTPRGP